MRLFCSTRMPSQALELTVEPWPISPCQAIHMSASARNLGQCGFSTGARSLKHVDRHLQESRTTRIRWGQVAGADVDLKRRNDQPRHGQGLVSGLAQRDELVLA